MNTQTTYRVRFVYDDDAQFEESNGEPRPLTAEEYIGNEYRACPNHLRGQVGSHPDPTRPGVGICDVCQIEFQDIPYDEYLAWYGNPDKHVYLGCQVQRSCTCCGAWATVADLWRIDFMDGDRELRAIVPDQWLSEADARQLPGYAGDTARELLDEARRTK